MKIFDYIGYFGPQILLLFSIYFLRNKSTLLYIYLLGMFINSLVNYVLKGLIKEPRPSEDVHIFNAELNNSKVNERRIGFDRFGMPSGHSQSVFFSLVFIHLALKNVRVSLFYLFICLTTLYQRIAYNNHTITQIIVGSVTGSMISFVFFKYARHLLKGVLKEKSDDNAPV